jgi:soluble lytic murein transglycosylase-like protein
LSGAEPPQLPNTRLTRAWLPALQREAERRRQRRRRLRRAVVALAAIDLLILVAVLIVVLQVADTSTPSPTIRLPAFVTGTARRRLAPAFARAATESHVPVGLVMGLTWRESEWQESEVSSAGAIGIGQLLPPTATFVAQDLLHAPHLDPRRAGDNIRLTARYLRELIDELGSNETLGVGAYLQGSTSVRAHGLSVETQAYVAQVEGLRQAFDRARRG